MISGQVPGLLKANQDYLQWDESLLGQKIKLLTAENIDVTPIFQSGQLAILRASLSSIQFKIKYLKLKSRMDFNQGGDLILLFILDPFFPAVLLFNYNEVIRPRGQALLSDGRNAIGKGDWAQIVQGTDAEFADRIGMNYQDFLKIKNERKQNPELDIRKPSHSNFFDREAY